MNPFNPYSYVSLNGHGTMRGLTLALPSEQVRQLLPYGLELGAQDVTPAGTHPVVVYFHDMFRAHMSIPSLLPSLTYHEHSLGVPFAYVTQRGQLSATSPGPYYFMPRLHLDSFLATLGGIAYWGYAKRMASFLVDANNYTVSSSRGTPITSLQFQAKGEFRPVEEFPLFAPIRKMLDQPLISMLPAALGPFFVCSNFDKQWSAATMRPMQTQMQIDEAYVPGLLPGAYPAEGLSPGIDQIALGSYELRAPWRVSMPYPPYGAGMASAFSGA